MHSINTRFITFDVETTGLDVHSERLIGIAFSTKPYEGFYLTLPKNKEKAKGILNSFKTIFEDETIGKVGHNIKFDIKILKTYGIEVKGPIHDTLVLDYVLYPEKRKHGLKKLSLDHLNYQQIIFNDIANGKKQSNRTLEGVPLEKVAKYACEDTDQTHQLYQFLLPKIEENHLKDIYKLDIDLVRVITDIEYTGVNIDMPKLNLIEKEFEDKLIQIKRKIKNIAKTDLKLNSQKQLNQFLFNELRLEPIGKRGKNGLYPLSKSNLTKMLGQQQEVISLILDYRQIVKVKNTFIKALKGVNPLTKKLHCSINQAVTETGRLSSSKPNLQNIPSRTIGKKLREVFIPSSDNHQLIGADYSNIELRLMAIISGDEVMLNSYRKGIDLHRLTTAKVLNIDFNEVTDDQRGMVGKTVNFGLIYGMTAKGLSESLTANTGEKYTVEQAQHFINEYFDLYKGVAKCNEQLIYDATIKGYTTTLFGRRRKLKNINSFDTYKRENAKRLALNTPIQGTAADIIRMAMINIHKRLEKEKLKSKMILQVHDELLFDVPKQEVALMEKLIKYEMENVVKLPIPLEVELKTGKNWAEVH